MYTPSRYEPVPTMVGTNGLWCPMSDVLNTWSASSGTVEAADKAYYYQFRIPSVCTARRMFWANGAAVAGNVGAAIYASTASGIPGAKQVECASTAQAGTNTLQFADITDTTLAPGIYWLALAASSGSATFFRCAPGGAATNWAKLFCFAETGVTVGSLPATATPAATTAGHIYLFGFATTASP